LFLMFTTLPFIFADKKDLGKWLSGFKAFALINSLVMIYSYFKTGAATGLIGMDSVDGSFTVIMFLLTGNNYISLGVMGLALFLSGSSTVFGALVLALLANFIFFQKKDKWSVLLATGFLGLVGIQLYFKHELLNDNGRSNILKKTLDVFVQIEPQSITKWLFGLGQSAFILIIPLVQDPRNVRWIWLHDEPMQIVFEQGLIGLGLISAVYLTGLYKVRKNRNLFLAMLAAGFESFLQPSFRYFIFALLMVFICRISFETENILTERG